MSFFYAEFNNFIDVDLPFHFISFVSRSFDWLERYGENDVVKTFTNSIRSQRASCFLDNDPKYPRDKDGIVCSIDVRRFNCYLISHCYGRLKQPDHAIEIKAFSTSPRSLRDHLSADVDSIDVWVDRADCESNVPEFSYQTWSRLSLKK